jgi:hypothetical protein
MTLTDLEMAKSCAIRVMADAPFEQYIGKNTQLLSEIIVVADHFQTSIGLAER